MNYSLLNSPGDVSAEALGLRDAEEFVLVFVVLHAGALYLHPSPRVRHEHVGFRIGEANEANDIT